MFPFTLELIVEGFTGGGKPVFTLPFKYTVKSGQHYGLLMRGVTRVNNRFCSSPTRKHFYRLAGVIANKVLAYYKKTGIGIRVFVTDERHRENVWFSFASHDAGLEYRLGEAIRRLGRRVFFFLQNQYTNMLAIAVAEAAYTHLKEAGYKPQPKPRKYIRKHQAMWVNYKGLDRAIVTRDSAHVYIAKNYDGSLLDIRILKEVIQHTYKYGKRVSVSWYVNTHEQALEARLLHPGTSYILVHSQQGEGKVLLEEDLPW